MIISIANLLAFNYSNDFLSQRLILILNKYEHEAFELIYINLYM